MWKKIESETDLAALNEQSFHAAQLIFKHSTRCSISSMALGRMQRAQQPEKLDIHLLDLLKFRNLSNKIAGEYNIGHESPQVLLIKDGKCVYHASHSEIDMRDIAKAL